MAAQTPVPGCNLHPGMGYVYICKTCQDTMICSTCVLEIHNTHKLGSLSDHVSGQRRQIEEYKERLSKTDMPKLKKDIQNNDQTDHDNSGCFSKMIDEIKQQGQHMKKDIDDAIEKLVKLCKNIEQLNADIVKKNKIALTKHLRDVMTPKLDRCQLTLISGTNNDVITMAREIRDTPTSSPALGTLRTADFEPGCISTDLLARMIGRVRVDGEDPTYRVNPSVTLLSSFKTPFRYDSCRISRTGGEAWLSFWDENIIYRVDRKGKVKEKIKCKVQVEHITISPTTGRVWFCSKEDRSIREVTTSGAIVTRFTVTNDPRSLSITGDDKVVVGLKWKGIQMYTTDGQVVTSSGGPCRQDAVSPNSMAYCSHTGDVAVVDWDNVPFDDYMAGKEPDKHPRVLVMDRHLNLKFKCQHVDDVMGSNADGSQQSKFYPSDVCFDAMGDVLVVECVTKSVMLVDGNTGHHIRTVYTSDGSPPYCISRQEDGVLWIGHNNNTMKIITYT